MGRKLAFFILTAGLVCLLSGCFFKSGEELYSLPKAPQDYYDLQTALDAVLAEGAEYSAPVSGSNQQSVQLVDLDGDGEEEAVAFFKTSGDDPLAVYIYQKHDGRYENVAAITGTGTAIESVEYAQLNDDAALEIILTWQVSDGVPQAMTVYSSKDFTLSELLVASFSEYTTVDLNSDGVSEIFLLHHDSMEFTGTAEYYGYRAGAMELIGQAQMSHGMELIKRIIIGRLEDGEQAVFVGGTYRKSGIITDIYAIKDGNFENITLADESNSSDETVRYYSVYAEDIDGDGGFEIPHPEQLPVYETSENGDVFWIINWYNYSLDGIGELSCTTYHNYTDGWYFVLPEDWEGNISIARSDGVSGERALTFCKWNGAEAAPTPVMTIYTLTGDNREERSHIGKRFVLLVKNEGSGTTYCAEFSEGAEDWSKAISREELLDRFRLIRSEWVTGEI